MKNIIVSLSIIALFLISFSGCNHNYSSIELTKLINEGKNRKVSRHLSNKIRRSDTCLNAYLMRAQISEGFKIVKQKKRIERDYEYAKKIDNSTRSQLLKAQYYFRQGRYKDAIAEFDAIIMRDTLDVPVYVFKANSLFAYGDTAEALNMYNKAVSKRRDESSVFYARGNFYFNIDSFSLALRDLTTSRNFKTSLSDNNIVLSEKITICYYLTGNLDSSCYEWNEIKARYPKPYGILKEIDNICKIKKMLDH